MEYIHHVLLDGVTVGGAIPLGIDLKPDPRPLLVRLQCLSY